MGVSLVYIKSKEPHAHDISCFVITRFESAFNPFMSDVQKKSVVQTFSSSLNAHSKQVAKTYETTK